MFPFENRGVEVGVTLSHPHGQIYAYPFVPPLPARELEIQRAHREKTGRGIDRGTRWTRRSQTDGASFTRETTRPPGCRLRAIRVRSVGGASARRRKPRRSRRSGASRLRARAEIHADPLRRALVAALPYVMVFHRLRRTEGRTPEAHLHIEFYPPLRMKDRLKYLAGSELGAGAFTADTLPEEKAAELRSRCAE